MKKQPKSVSPRQLAIWILAFLPLLLIGVLYTRLPEQMPMHWDFNGTVSYSDKWQLLIVALMSPVMAVTFWLCPKMDPHQENYAKFGDGYETFQLVMMLFMLVIIGICLIEGLRPNTVNVSLVICALCSLLLVVLGNMMPKFRQNFFCGIKNPWTLSSETVWVRTHRFGGRLMFGAGIIGLIGAFVPNEIIRFVALLVPSMIAALIPTLYSYLLFRREKQNG